MNLFITCTLMDPVLFKSITSGDLSSLNVFSADVLLNQLTVTNNTALHVAAQSGVFSSAEAICARCPSLRRHKNAKGDTPLHIAAREGRTEIVRLLVHPQHKNDLERGGLEGVGALLSMTNKKIDTALHMAARNNHFEVVKLLTEADPELEYFANEAGETPLYLAAEDGQYQMVQHILTTCSSPSHSGPDGRTTLQAAILRNQLEIARLLMDKKPDLIKQVDKKGCTPLHCAARVGNVEVIEYVTQRFPDIWEAVDEDGCNFLHFAATCNQIKVVKHVLGNKEMADFVLNGQNNKGNTPLHHAANMDNRKDSKLLLRLVFDKRVNLNTMNDEHLTALDLTDQKKLVRKMKKAGAIKSPRKELVEAQHGKTRQYPWDAAYLREWKERVSTELVVNALIATVSFTAGLTVPGGFIPPGHTVPGGFVPPGPEEGGGPKEGTAVLQDGWAFQAFYFSNTIAMWLSAYAILLHSWARRETNTDKIYRLVWTASRCTILGLLAMVLAFVMGSFAVVTGKYRLVTSICVMGCSFLYFSVRTFIVS